MKPGVVGVVNLANHGKRQFKDVTYVAEKEQPILFEAPFSAILTRWCQDDHKIFFILAILITEDFCYIQRQWHFIEVCYMQNQWLIQLVSKWLTSELQSRHLNSNSEMSLWTMEISNLSLQFR